MEYAPVALFVYNRLSHTMRVVKSLQSNNLAYKTELYVFSDGSKNVKADGEVIRVREFVKNIKGFKKVNIIKQSINIGLSASIIKGVTKVINEHGKVIVVEDDLLCSPTFLSYMNNALDKYEKSDKIWHISGWNYPIEVSFENTDAYFWRSMNCWGWATWAGKWRYFEKDPNLLVSTWKDDDIHRFNLDGANDFWSQVTQNRDGIIDTWAIFWYATIFSRQGLCLNPFISQVLNIGFDGSGEHCTTSIDQHLLNMDKHFKNFTLPSNYVENYAMVERIKKYYLDQLLITNRVFRKIKKIVKFIELLLK